MLGRPSVALLLLIAAFVILTMFFWSFKNRLLFHPLVLSQPPQLPKGVDRAMLEVEPGVSVGLYYTADSSPKQGTPIVYCHGNAGNVMACVYLFRYCSNPLVIWDYRGFGESGGQATVQNVLQDLDKVLDWTAQKWACPKNELILWGRSLGTNIVLQHVDKCQHSGKIILHTPFSKLSDVISSLGYACLSWMCYVVGNMDVRPCMQRLLERGGQALLLASKEDKVTPWQSAAELVQGPGVVLKEIPGSHYAAFEDWSSVQLFLGAQQPG